MWRFFQCGVSGVGLCGLGLGNLTWVQKFRPRCFWPLG